jgi:hypothetical protein
MAARVLGPRLAAALGLAGAAQSNPKVQELEKQAAGPVGQHLGQTLAGQAPTVANMAPRALHAADFGIQGTVDLQGTFEVVNGTAIARVENLAGEIGNPFQLIGNIKNTAQAAGATMLEIEASLANPRLYEILKARYGMVTEGGRDFIRIGLRR